MLPLLLRRLRPLLLALPLAALLAGCSKGCGAPAKKALPPPPTTTTTTTTTTTLEPLELARRRAHDALALADLDSALQVLDAALATADAAPTTPPELLTLARCDRAAVLSQRAAKDTATPATRERDLRGAVKDCPSEPLLTRALAHALVGRARELTDPRGDNKTLRRSLLEESLRLEKTLPAAVDLARLCDEQDDGACAAAAAEQALALAPGDGKIIELRDRLKRLGDVEGGFKSARHSHFVARFEGYGEERLAWGALDLLEQTWFSIGKAIDLYPAKPITVVIYTGDQYKQATATPDWSSGIFDGKIRIREGLLAAEQGTLQHTLTHEYVHAALRNCVPGDVPTWFHEGLAQHFEGDRPDAAALVTQTGKAPLSILSGSFLGLNEADARAAYATSLWMVQRLIEKRGVYGVQQLLAEMKQERSFDEAMQRAFAQSPTALWSSL